MKNIEAKNLKNENDKKENDIKNKDSSNKKDSINILLKKIFYKSKNDLLLPIIRKNSGEELKNIFNKIPENISCDSLSLFVIDKINFIKEIKKLIYNKYETIHILNNYLLKYDISLFKYYIDLYIKYLFSSDINKNEASINSKDNIIKDIQEILVWLITCGLLNKDIIDYAFQKISKLQLEEKLTITSFNIFIPLIEILYGKNELNIKHEEIAKSYIYLFDKNNSIIKTNISPSNIIKINNGICIVLWFYLYEYCNEKEKTKGTICQIISNNLQKIDVIITNEYDIEVKFNTKELFKEKNESKFKVNVNTWIQLKIQFIDNKIKLFLFQNLKENSYKLDNKTYLINNENKTSKNNKNNKYDELNFNNFTIFYLNFFMGYEGLVGTILFFNNSNSDKNLDKVPINCISGLQNNKINDFIQKIKLQNIYFIISPSLYSPEDNKFIDSNNGINAELSLERNGMNLNSIIKIHNYTKNIFYLGGCNNLLPLFEILYNLSNKFINKKTIENDESINYELMICNLLNKLFKLMELVFINKKKNCIEAYENSNHFFESLQLFLENMDERFFNGDIYFKFNKIKNDKEKENYLISSLLNIGRYFCEIKSTKILNQNEKHGFFKNILFYPTIVMKFSSFQQNIIFSFFEKIKKEINSFNNSEYRNYFISFDNITKLLKSLSERNDDESLPSNLYNIIKIIFEDEKTKDNERESLILLYNNHLLSHKVFINILEIFTIYFDINIFNKKVNTKSNNVSDINKENKELDALINMRNNSIKYFLYSSNFFIENLLNIMLTTNLYIKKLIINFLRILTNKYNSILEEYFSFVNECNKNYKNKRINKKDFLYFIRENLFVNPKNKIILSEFEKEKNKKKRNNILIKKRKSSLEDIICRKNLEQNKNANLNSIKRVKSFDEIKTNKKIEIFDSLTKNKKRKKIKNNKEVNDKNNKRSNSTSKNNLPKNKNIFYKLIDKQNKMEKTKLIYKKRNNSSINLNIDLINKAYETKLLNKPLEINTNFLLNNNNKKLNIKKYKLKSSQKNQKNKKNQNKKCSKANSNKNVKNEIKNDIYLSLEEININCDISMILYDWLVQIKYNKKKNKNNNDSLDKSVTIEYINQILNYIVKFLSNMTELEVIYRTLFIFLGQKSTEQSGTNKAKYNQNYLRLLSYFSKSHSFRQLLEEIIIDSYLGFNNDEKTINKYSFNQNISKLIIKSTKNVEFEKIYNLTKELLIDIYFYKHNISSNLIIYELYNIILKKYNGFQTPNNDIIHKLSIFLKNIFNEIINKYHSLLNENNDNTESNSFDSNNSNNINTINNNNNMSELKNINIYKNYIYFFTLFFESSIVFKNYFKFLNKKNNKSENTYLTFPKFIKEGLIYQINSENKVENLIFFDEYKLIINDLKEIYDLKNIFRELKISSNELDKTNEIFHLDIETIQKIVNEMVFQKDTRGKFKKYIELLFISYNQSGYFNNFPLINILSLNKCILLNHDNDIEINNNLIIFLNDIQNYIISIILLSCNIKKDDSYSDNNLNYDDIQDIIYQNLLFIIRNIIYKYVIVFKNKEDKNEKDNEIKTNNINNLDENEDNMNYENEEEETYENYFVAILNNIISLLSYIYIKNKDSQNTNNSFLSWKKSKKYNDISLTSANKLIEYYIKTDESFFNLDNLNFFSNNNNNDSNFLIIKQRKKLYYNLVEKCIDKSNVELFNYKIFKSICLGREHEIKKKMKLLLVANQGKNRKKHKQKKTNKRYRNLLIKIHNLKIEDERNNKLVEESRNELMKIKKYRKIKKYLYSYNNSFSNLEAFYSNNKNYFIPYKISNYLSTDQTRKLLVPVLDFYYYLPNFRKFKSVKEKMFKKNISNKIYKINLKIIDKERVIITPEINNKKFYVYKDICLIKTTHHIRGKLFYEVQNDSFKQNNKNFCLYFAAEKNISKEYLLSNCPDYDSVYNSCFGSLFRNNLNKKDDGFYLEIKLSDINFIFFRKYCYRNNSIELFLNNHKTYYFKFKNTNDRNNFVEQLINVLNQISNKKIFKNIKGIDENNKSTIGYYKDIDNNKDYKNINEIKDLWKNSKISTLEYIMWINIYGNRSFRDVAQYPVLPWILNDYSLNNFDSIINLNSIRNFNLPMGMMALDEKSIQRKEGYIEGYKLMVNDISEEINIKKPNEVDDDEVGELKSSIRSEDLTKDSDDDNNSIKNMSNEKGDNLKIPNYKYDLEKLYYNLNIEYDRIPYIYGTHYSNPMYVSHYLSRLFPYSFNMIEIQGDSFDCAERLFFSVKNAFYSSTREKCDLRELIPEFFTLPEIFLNINELNFGKTRDKNYVSQMKSLTVEEEKEENISDEDNIISTSSENIEYLEINDVALPPWTKQSPYLFIKAMKEIFEGEIELNKSKEKYINLNPWIDLIFGYYQRGIKAQNKGNIFLPYSYDGVIAHRIKEEDILKSRSDYEFMIRYFEIGVTPTKVFEKKCKDKKKEINYQITYIKNNETLTLNKKDCIKLKTNTKIIYLKNKLLGNNKLILIDKNYIGYNITLQQSNETINNINEKIIINEEDSITNNYSIKESQAIRDFPLTEINRKNVGYKIIMKSVFKELLYIVTGYYDGSIYFINTTNKNNKRNGHNISSELNSKENNKLHTFGNKLITSLEISKFEKYMICGNEKGALIIFSLNYISFIENKKYVELLTIIESHNQNRINSISINDNLNLFADCSYDGYINLYTFPKLGLIKSIFINDKKLNKKEIDYVFLSSQPLPVVVVYSNKKCLFKSYSINGQDLNYDSNDMPLLEEIEMPSYNIDNMISPIIFTDYKFNDYLCYIFKNKFIVIRKFPEMKYHLKFNCFNHNCCFSFIHISRDLKNIYAYEENEKNLYIINNLIYKKENKDNSIGSDNSRNKIK